jgi:thioredoxin-dependent peroxiredoxin
MQIGDPLPDLTVASTGNERLRLLNLRSKPLVLYFYPRDATPGCTREAQDFAARHAQFAAAGARVLGVSRDALASHRRFQAAQGLAFDLISDSDETLCHAFDVIREKSMYGRKVIGIERSTFLFDGEGRLRQIWRPVKVPGHADAVLAAVQALA